MNTAKSVKNIAIKNEVNCSSRVLTLPHITFDMTAHSGVSFRRGKRAKAFKTRRKFVKKLLAKYRRLKTGLEAIREINLKLLRSREES